MTIDDISLKIIPDSRGNDTLEAEFKAGDLIVVASVPSGKSTGSTEAVVIDPKIALEKFKGIKAGLLEQDYSLISQFDSQLGVYDGTPNFSVLGGNLALVLSIGFTKLLAKNKGLQTYELIALNLDLKTGKMPLCFYNLIEGGVHAENSLPFQEYLYVTQTNSPKESLTQVMEFIKTLGEKIQKQYEQLKQGDEGGYTVPSRNWEDGLKILKEVIGELGQNGKISLDIAASALFKNGTYSVGDRSLDREALMLIYRQIVNEYDMLSIEDPFNEEDVDGFVQITKELGGQVWVVGDDLTTTHPGRVKMMAENGAANAVIIKPNQVGTVTDTLRAVSYAKTNDWKIIVSHRSGETMDNFIADLAVGVQADGLKSGCPLQKERLIKYQRLIEIESLLRPS